MTPAAEVLAAAERREAATTSEATPLPLPPPLGNLASAHGRGSTRVAEKLKVLLPGSHDGYVSLDEVTLDMAVDSGEKTRLIQSRDRVTRRTNSFVSTTAGAAKGAMAAAGKVAKVASTKVTIPRHAKGAASMTAVELSESPPSSGPERRAHRDSRLSEVSTTASDLSARDAMDDSHRETMHKRDRSNPFMDDGAPSVRASTDHDYSDNGIPSPRLGHRRSTSGGAWSEVSYTTSDDGMLRMCHTSLAPTKPRRWTKGDNLGEGSYGSVWLALNGDTGELFALKEVRVGSSDKHRDESIEQLEQEVDVLSRLVHPNIVRYIGITRQETALYIFLEYVPGGSIASLVQRFGKFEENVIRVYTRQILIGLAYLHSQRVVHRDIKGANILVEKSGRIKLADFGMAKVLERVSIGKSFKGSACWMAPEVIRQQNIGFEADIWSVGCTVYEMSTGSPPWSDCSTQVQIIFKIASSNEIPDIPEDLSPEGQDFLRLCLQRDAEMRPEAVALLDEPFVLDAHRSSDHTQNIPGLQYDTWASSSAVDDGSILSSEADPSSRVNSSRHVAWEN
jgi:mitogen-activated protein kinase kinase kinase